MRILLTNDDGIYAPGLRALRAELLKLGTVTVVAPATEQSAAGHSVTLLTPLLVNEVYEDDATTFVGWAVEGRPADCVKLALLELLPEPPDVIISGMNAGSNAGINVLYSGTVAAAIEGAFYRHTAIAVSLEYDKKIYDFPTAAKYARQVIEQILARKPMKGSLFNVNLPVLEHGPIHGVRVMPQNVSPYTEKFDRRVNPRGRTYFWTNPEFTCPDPHPDTDVTALSESYITVTPLQFDLTDHAKMEHLKEWEWKVE
ncbi:stationary phase survival protein : 5'-nucleotidase SurE OS=Singulisphaera acidiphila (strain ATCC BAA-1392 / DSM 18658 / VKM B-2454 / MOB10) GN=surE PE=3 SV=1: SurE [Gemmata massiliana]|uniref:5'-nucleotidase SurE n=1 Tax=Gemmata massiliana TaxID=1210884 RepID=A0A6P2D5J1_9BACT|nr:5'/3'-nucleotidase SurE [Gemmata massiliana]VTR95364.1 stationary phase survival protein : 5'-nucleotidase SurE OS=Singulisphaera acidiphila (strain ATCC BAA-1392 / DSM 18658 / VKM B-2454 / MOB10) GN=surE PE=3 SV=1: SurE [Gemmata massiliana]